MEDEIVEKIRLIDGIEQVEYCPSQDGKLVSFIFRANGDKRYGGSIGVQDGKLNKEDLDVFLNAIKATINGNKEN